MGANLVPTNAQRLIPEDTFVDNTTYVHLRINGDNVTILEGALRMVDVSGYTVDGQDRYAAIWEQGAGPGWQARHGLTADAYQRAFDELAGQGYRLVDVSGYGSNGQDRYAAIWEQSPGPAWQARHGLTADAYQRTFDELAAQGYRLRRVSGYEVNGQDRYAAIWEQAPGGLWEARHGMSPGTHQQVFNQLTGVVTESVSPSL